MSDFSLENPVAPLRRGGRQVSERVSDAPTFAKDHPGEWFVYDSETLTGDSPGEYNKIRTRINQRTGRLRKSASEQGLNVEITTRLDSKIVKGYARLVNDTEESAQ